MSTIYDTSIIGTLTELFIYNINNSSLSTLKKLKYLHLKKCTDISLPKDFILSNNITHISLINCLFKVFL